MDGHAPPCPALDEAALVAHVSAALRDGGPDAARRAAAPVLRATIAEGRAAVRAALRAQAVDGLGAARALAAVTDAVVRGAMAVASVLHPNPNPTQGERLSVCAVGGYGRAEMAPFSDVDLLFLRPYKNTAWGESMIETALYLLWDLRLKVGHSVRTVDECLRLAGGDVTIRTALLEKRLIWGDAGQFETLDRRLWSELFEKTGRAFVEAKLAERDARHARQGGSRYLVEPNVKESKGGLRDLQTLYWIAKYLYHCDSVGDLVARGVFTGDEVATFDAAERFLWTVRCHLHFVAGRAQEHMTFDLQVEIADEMGFKAEGGLRAVERFMQGYFRAAKDVGDLTRWFCAALEQAQKKTKPATPMIARLFGLGGQPVLAPGFRLRDGRIDVEGPETFDRDPANMLRLFEEGLRTGALVHPGAMRMIAARLDKVDDALRADPAANRIFLKLLTRSDDPERALRRMNECGLLGRFVPAFGRIVAMMQFNMYHHYTVDEHSILAVGGLKRLEKGALNAELPVASEILRAGFDREVLYTALFLHDIGKGLPEDHSEVGARVAEHLCPRLGLDAAQTEMVVWLVRHHLLMSDVAQKRDIADPRTVRAFADVVRTPERLRLLVVLTACDIRAVGPGTWNNWKAQLLRNLYFDTRTLLTGGAERLSRAERVEEAKQALAATLADWPAAKVAAEIARHYPPYWLGLDASAHAAQARLADGYDGRAPALAIDPEPERDATRVLIHMADHPGLFSRMAAALALARASVVDARTFTTADGMATSAFWIQDLEGRAYDPDDFDRLKRSIRRALKGELAPRAALAEKRRAVKKRERPFEAPTRITFDNEASDIYTVIEVDTRDRFGLLYDLTSTLADASINIFSAVIATYGEQAVDVFYVKDLFGLKVRSPAKQQTIARKLRAAIDRAAEDTRPVA
ncbi:MAG: [protein-PII] uridylyltransferase [Rhodobacteraceae bacterium]|nr:MAG: [protein-PII] uridylyltransferase [Paracoccaceae bacterium]